MPAVSHLSFVVANVAVELLALEAQEVLPRKQNPTLGGDGAGRVDVVAGDHPDRDPRPLAFEMASGTCRYREGETRHFCVRPDVLLALRVLAVHFRYEMTNDKEKMNLVVL